LLWDRNNYEYSDKYDYVIISYCLVFKNYHEDPIDTIYNLLNENGICIIVSPTKGKTLDLFLKLAEKKFKLYISQEEIKFYFYSLDKNESLFFLIL
jgi:hypothetical protein